MWPPGRWPPTRAQHLVAPVATSTMNLASWTLYPTPDDGGPYTLVLTTACRGCGHRDNSPLGDSFG